MVKLNQLFFYLLAAVILPFFASCSDNDDNNDNNKSNEDKVEVEIPDLDFSKSMDAVRQSETARGFEVVADGSYKLNATKKVNSQTITLSYFFDPSTTEYRYAKGTYDTDKERNAVLKKLAESGFAAADSANGVSFYKNATTNIEVAFYDEKKAFYALPNSEDPLAWGRFDYLTDKDKAGLIVPYLGKYATGELITLAEQYHGNHLNKVTSNEATGVYVFDVTDTTKGYTEIRYWLDQKTKSQLEEAAIYFDEDKRPTTDEIATYMNYLGLKYTSLKDASDGSQIYFNYQKKFVAYLSMDKPEDTGTVFAPNIHFTFNDLSAQMPPETVTIPEPITDFNTMTLNEAVEKYKKLPYYTGTEDDGFGGALGIIVTTSSPDFPKILLMEDSGKYLAAFLLPNNAMTLRSPSIKDWLTEKGYEYNAKASILPTYISKDNKVMAQFDIDGAIAGMPCLVFQPKE